MLPHERVTAAIRAANGEGRTALVPFVTAGYPEPSSFVVTLREVAAAGDVVEIGIPFSDPMADGMTIQRSSFTIEAPLVMMSYLNPLLAFGYDALAERAHSTGVCAFIVPDLPYEESEALRQALEPRGLGLVQLVTPATPDARLKKLCAASRGFVYAVTIRGITGGGAGLPRDLATYLDKVSATASLPVCAGFGIRSAADVASVGRHAAGAIVGSALVEVLEKGDSPSEFLERLLA
jgi:tryptophan synthase alpha chain